MQGTAIHPTDAMLANPGRRLAFHILMTRVDNLVWQTLGCSVYDLPDCAFADWFADGMVPASAARKAMRAAREG